MKTTDHQDMTDGNLWGVLSSTVNLCGGVKSVIPML